MTRPYLEDTAMVIVVVVTVVEPFMSFVCLVHDKDQVVVLVVGWCRLWRWARVVLQSTAQ